MNLSMFDRFGSLAIAGAILFIALRVHKSSGKHVKRTKVAGIIMAFLAGCAMLVTVVGGWLTSVAAGGQLSVAGLIVCGGIVAVDWLLDGKPDRPAFWAAFALPIFLVLGGASLSTAGDQTQRGVDKVQTVVDHMGK